MGVVWYSGSMVTGIRSCLGSRRLRMASIRVPRQDGWCAPAVFELHWIDLLGGALGCRPFLRAQGMNDGNSQIGSILVGGAADHLWLQRVRLDCRREDI